MPTTSRSSPTTTSAVNEKRRPPFTTLATRLISTTRSWRSYWPGLTERDRAMRGPEATEALEAQPALARPVGERLHAPVVAVTAAIEDDRLDAGALRPLGKQRTR